MVLLESVVACRALSRGAESVGKPPTKDPEMGPPSMYVHDLCGKDLGRGGPPLRAFPLPQARSQVDQVGEADEPGEGATCRGHQQGGEIDED